ncbi:hypothetical protein ACFO4L_11455 [Bacillus daqingensis]|uniref:DUF3139 domain-containing protein n=1 Tax=Bacillus daqingensis TaxID=872396 RepID=A0ABV9NY27_9BACI
MKVFLISGVVIAAVVLLTLLPNYFQNPLAEFRDHEPEAIVIDQFDEGGSQVEQTVRLEESAEIEEVASAFREADWTETDFPDGVPFYAYTLRFYEEELMFNIDLFDDYMEITSMETGQSRVYEAEDEPLQVIEQYTDDMEPIGELD